MNVKRLLRKIVDFFYFRETLSFFTVMTAENKVIDYCWVLGTLAHKFLCLKSEKTDSAM